MTNIYQDISTRTGGNIYIGVVGPVRTGKSTFIQKVMEHLVINEIDDPFIRQRTLDELPQASTGKTIMTTEPKFVPENAIQIKINDKINCNIRMVDCVGFVVDGALGLTEGDVPRMVRTPWNDDEIPFETAAKIGTQKVIREHSTIGIVVTTDGSIGDILRNDYITAERQVIEEMKASGKPFVIVLNSMFPNGEQTVMISDSLQKEYDVPVITKNCSELSKDDIEDILGHVLKQFPISQISVDIPGWITYLPNENEIKAGVYECLRRSATENRVANQIESFCNSLCENKYIDRCELLFSDMGKGDMRVKVEIKQELYFGIISEILDKQVKDDGDLMLELISLQQNKHEYDKIKTAFDIAQNNGYGIVSPAINDLHLEKPESYRQGNRFGVKLKASAPTFHIIKADIYSEISPIVGDEEQAKTLIQFIEENQKENIDIIWQYDIFGKSIFNMVNDGLQEKYDRLPDDARCKLQETLTKILNEGSGGLICIIL